MVFELLVGLAMTGGLPTASAQAAVAAETRTVSDSSGWKCVYRGDDYDKARKIGKRYERKGYEVDIDEDEDEECYEVWCRKYGKPDRPHPKPPSTHRRGTPAPSGGRDA